MDTSTFGAAGADVSSFASPLEQVFRNVPKSHEKPLRQAMYNVLAILVFGIITYGTYYVVFVLLWPFFLPIMWALMSGLVIHPHKTRLAATMRQTLADLAGSDRTTLLELLSGTLRFADGACDAVGNFVYAKWKMMLVVGLVFMGAHLSLTFDSATVPWFFSFVWSSLERLHYVSDKLSDTRSSLSCAILTFIISVFVFWKPKRNLIFKVISHLLWIWLFLYSLNFISFIYCLGSFVVLRIMLKSSEQEEDKVDSARKSDSPSKRTKFREIAFALLRKLQGSPSKITDIKAAEEKEGIDGEEGELAVNAKVPEELRQEMSSTPNNAAKSDKNQQHSETLTSMPNAKIEHPGVSAIRRFHLGRATMNTSGMSEICSSPQSQRNNFNTPTSARHLRKHYRTVLSRGSAGSCSDSTDGRSSAVKESDLYINLVTVSFFVLQLWNHLTFLYLMCLPLLYCGVKRALLNFGEVEQVQSLASKTKAWVRLWLLDRADVLIPDPVRLIWYELGNVKRSALQALPKYADTIVTMVLILACIVVSVIVLVIVSVQIYAECLYMVQIGGRVFATVANSSIYEQLNQVNEDGNNSYAKGLEDAVDSAYHYGRDYISATVTSWLGESRDRIVVNEFETKVLELWDRIYQYWLSASGPASASNYGPKVSQEAIALSAEEVFHRFLTMNDFNLASVSQFAVNNVGTLSSVLEQGWVLLTNNASFALGVATEVIRILFLSGYGMVNFGFSMVIYFSVLFYLLKIEGPVYKPVEVISSYGHLVGDGFASALNKAVNSVFTLTAKMAYFYGLWTYVTHTLFRASIVTVPVLASAFLAAVPVAGQFLVSLPAALQLWLAEDRWGSALALIACHLVPPYVVDAAIYSEVRHGIHPYITGLSIIGGVYCFGIPGGAIYGPVILCIVYVVWTMTMYTGFLTPFGFDPLPNDNLGKSKLVYGTPHLKRSESIF